MKIKLAFRLPSLGVVDVTGKDAAAIVHNVTTNEVKTLATGDGRETFVTDVRGKTLGHGCLYRLDDRLRFIGPAGQSETLIAHIDRYTICEDATPSVRDEDFVAFVFSPAAAASLVPPTVTDDDAITSGAIACSLVKGTPFSATLYRTRWLGEGTGVLMGDVKDAAQIESWITEIGLNVLDVEAFHRYRTLAAFPWYGTDTADANLPQEADRDSVAVSFTKGCYLGQETVARLDALGQVQKKLVPWSIAGVVPPPGTKLDFEGKTVGRLTSVAANDPENESAGATAIGFARRSHFEAGATATFTDDTGIERTATVMLQSTE